MPENGSNGSAGLGNTVTRPASKKRYSFTLNNYTNEEKEDLLNFGSNKCKIYIFGYEVGIEGTPHIQGYIHLFKKDRFTSLKKNYLGFKRAHIEVSKGDDLSNINYCSKNGVFDTNYDMEIPLVLIQNLRPWQESLKNMLLSEPDNRGIIWIFDPDTNNGKTSFMKYMVYHFKCPFSYGGKNNDVINLIFNNQKYFKNKKNPMMFFNFTKQVDVDFINYSTFEAIKDGCISNNKFETGCFIMNTPHVVILCNTLPNTSKMGDFRFLIYTIDDNKLSPYDVSNKKRKYGI